MNTKKTRPKKGENPKTTKRGGFGSPLSNLQYELTDVIISNLDVRSVINLAKTNKQFQDQLQPTLEQTKSKYSEIKDKLTSLLSSIPARQPFEFEEVLELENLFKTISELHDFLDNFLRTPIKDVV